MIQREENPTPYTTNPIWKHFKVTDTKSFYYNQCFGSITLNSPSVPEEIRGGINAEEMGRVMMIIVVG